MVMPKKHGLIEHKRFYDLPNYLKKGDVLVFNESRVIPARLMGRKSSGGKVEILLLHVKETGTWETLVKPSQRVREGTIIEIGSGDLRVTAEVIAKREGGIRTIRFSGEENLNALGIVPLPPYIHTPIDNPERYQTVYARVTGSVAAPTAGLHFTPDLLAQIQQKGVDLAFVSLHVGMDSFSPVKVDDPDKHLMHKEYGEVNQRVADQLTQAKAEGRRIICVGTTSVRLLETAAQASTDGRKVAAFSGWTGLFILPGYEFLVPDVLITNFHLPKSTLLMLVCAFTGTEKLLRSYKEAMEHRYRFYSFGDAMLIL